MKPRPFQARLQSLIHFNYPDLSILPGYDFYYFTNSTAQGNADLLYDYCGNMAIATHL